MSRFGREITASARERAWNAICSPFGMTQNGMYEPPPQIPKRHVPWFTKLLFAFALLMLVLVVYGFVRASPSVLPDERSRIDVPAQRLAGVTAAWREARPGGWSAAAH